MTTSERTLRKWRKEALLQVNRSEYESTPGLGKMFQEATKRILALTQELLDQHLLKK